MKSWLEKNSIEMYSAHNERKSVVAERFIITLKNKIYKYMTSVSKNVYIDKLDDIVNEYNSTYHSTIKLKPVYVKSNIYWLQIQNLKLVIVLQYQKIRMLLQKVTLQIRLKTWLKLKVIKKVKNTLPWTCIINDLNEEEIVRTFYKNKLQKKSIK